MNEKAEKSNGRTVIQTMLIMPLISIIVGASVMLISYFTNGKNMKVVLRTWSNAYTYYLLIILLVTFPFYLNDLKKRGVTKDLLKKEIVDKNKLPGDILFGVLSGIVGYLVMSAVYLLIPFKDMGTMSAPTPKTPVLIRILVLVIIAPFIKEIIFRLYPKLFLEKKYGTIPTILISSIIFNLFDWDSIYLSFILGICWYAFYIKRRRLIVPIIGHAIDNLIGIVAFLIINLK